MISCEDRPPVPPSAAHDKTAMSIPSSKSSFACMPERSERAPSEPQAWVRGPAVVKHMKHAFLNPFCPLLSAKVAAARQQPYPSVRSV